MDFLGHFLVAAGLFVAIDAVWIGVVANKFYKQQLGNLMAPKPNMVPAVIFYAVYMTAIVVFVIGPGLDRDSLSYVVGHGALFGLAMYSTYDLTNHATLKGWPAKLTYVDLLWGTFITTLVSTLTFVIFK